MRSNRPVYTNTPIRGCHDLDLATLLRGKYNNCVLILDEAYAYLESRSSGKKLNLALSYVLFQARKTGLTILTTEQELGTIDVRFRTQCKYLVQAVNERLRSRFRYAITRFVNAHPVGTITRYLSYLSAERYFPMFDTYKTVDPLSRFDDVERLTATPERKMARAEEIAAEVKSYYADKRVTHARLNSYFELHALPRYLRETVWTLITDDEEVDEN